MSDVHGRDTNDAGYDHNEQGSKSNIFGGASGGSDSRGSRLGENLNTTILAYGRSIMGLNELGRVLYNRFDDLGHPDDIKNAIRCFRLGISLTSDWHAVRRILLTTLGLSYRGRFAHDGELSDLNNAIRCYSQAAVLTPDGEAEKLEQLRELGNSYMSRFERKGQLADADKAIHHYGQAVLLTPDDHARKTSLLLDLGNSYLGRFSRLGELVDICNSIHHYERAVLLVPEDDLGKPELLSRLGRLYMAKYKCTEEPADIDKAIHCQSQAISLTPDGHSGKPGWLADLGSSYMRRFEHIGLLLDIDKAIEYQGQAVSCTPDSHSDRPRWLHSLGISYRSRFERNGQLSDINKAIHYHDLAAQLNPELAGRPGWLGSLGSSYNRRFEHNGELSDLNRAIEYHTQAVLLTPDGYADKPRWLSNLGTSYLARFERLGEVADIDKAIHHQGQSVLLTPDSDSCKPGLLNNLGMSYACRFERLDEVADADKSIECHSQSLFLTPDGHVDKANWFGHLGNSYMRRFNRSGALLDLLRATDSHIQAVLLTPDGHPVKAIWLNSLGNSYLLRFKSLGLPADVEKAIAYHEQAVQVTPDGHSVKPRLFNNLGNSYQARFGLGGELSLADVNKSINYHSQAVLLTPDGHSDKLGLLDNLGKSYQSRFHSLGKLSDIKAANRCFERTAQFVTGDPHIRFLAARQWSRSLYLLGSSPQRAYYRIMELVPELVWLGSTIKQRYGLLIQIGDVAMEAASSAISLKESTRALEWLEQGRSIVWNQILQLRTPFHDLAAADSALASRLKGVGRELEYAGSRSAVPPSLSTNTLDLEQVAQYHRRLAVEWGQLIKQARQLPGFHNFMRPKMTKDLISAAKDGPVVVINVHSSRCDALIIVPNSSHVANVPLENFSQQKAANAHAQLLSLVGPRGARAGGFKRTMSTSSPETMFKKVLADLWFDVVKPILDFLEFTRKQPINKLPHVTWCTTGVLSFLPLHAAGCYDGLHPNAFDLVVSSYTPTLSALLQPNLPSQPPSGILAVGQQHTNGLTSLPYTIQELATIDELAKGTRHLQLDGDSATVESVLNAMDAYSWVHLACHASQNTTDPGQSAFHLHDGNLLLSDITKRSFKNKGLAFLSACQTATGDKNLPDEAVHLAAGMLMAGYPSVIATMWSIDDEDAPDVARNVYAELLQDGKMDHTRASRALHRAVAGLREKIGEKAFSQWVPFVHIGS